MENILDETEARRLRVRPRKIKLQKETLQSKVIVEPYFPCKLQKLGGEARVWRRTRISWKVNFVLDDPSNEVQIDQ